MQDSNPTLNSLKPMSTQPMPNEFSTLAYRLDSVEKQLGHLSGQLSLYVPQRENELQLRAIQDSVRDIKDDVAEMRRQLGELTTKIINQDAVQRERQDKIQIRALGAIVSSVAVVVTGVIVGLVLWFTTH